MRNTTESKSRASHKSKGGEEFLDWDINKIREILYITFYI